MSFFVPAVPGRRGTSLINTLRNRSLLTNLKGCFDAGDLNSYSGTGQTIGDLSGNARSFVLGTTSSGEATKDPTYTGTAGRQSSGEYFRNPDYTFGISDITADTFIKNLAKDNAIYTFMGVFRVSQLDATNGAGLMLNASAATPDGIAIGVDAATGFSGKVVNRVTKSGPADVAVFNSGITMPVGAPTFVAFSYDEASGAYVFQVNGTQATGTKTYSSPSTSDGATRFGIITSNDPSGGYSGDVFNFACFAQALSASELNSIYSDQKAKFAF